MARKPRAEIEQGQCQADGASRKPGGCCASPEQVTFCVTDGLKMATKRRIQGVYDTLRHKLCRLEMDLGQWYPYRYLPSIKSKTRKAAIVRTIGLLAIGFLFCSLELRAEGNIAPSGSFTIAPFTNPDVFFKPQSNEDVPSRRPKADATEFDSVQLDQFKANCRDASKQGRRAQADCYNSEKQKARTALEKEREERRRKKDAEEESRIPGSQIEKESLPEPKDGMGGVELEKN